MRPRLPSLLRRPTPTLTLDVDGERIILDESFMDFSDFTPEETALVAIVLKGMVLDGDGDPTAGSVAVHIYIKLSRSRPRWGKDHVDAVVPLLVAWLTGRLIPVEAGEI